MSVELVGREAELAALCDLVAATRLVEIVGAGGIGKTAIAIAAGRTLVDSRTMLGRVASGWRGSKPPRPQMKSSTC